MTGVLSGLLFGLLGAVLIGFSDAITRVTGRRLSILLLTTLLFLISCAPLIVMMALTDGWPPLDAELWGVAALSGFFNAVGLALLFIAIARGPLAVASPAASAFSVILIGLNILDGAPFRLGHGVGAALMTAAILVLAAPDRRRPAARSPAGGAGVTAAIGLAAAGFIALRMFTAQEIAEPMGELGATFSTRLVAGLCAGTALLVWRASGKRFTPAPLEGLRRVPPIWILVGVQAALEATALTMFLIGGAGAEGDRIASAIGYSAFAAFSPLIAWALWSEEVTRRQALCIALAILGAAATALA